MPLRPCLTENWSFLTFFNFAHCPTVHISTAVYDVPNISWDGAIFDSIYWTGWLEVSSFPGWAVSRFESTAGPYMISFMYLLSWRRGSRKRHSFYFSQAMTYEVNALILRGNGLSPGRLSALAGQITHSLRPEFSSSWCLRHLGGRYL